MSGSLSKDAVSVILSHSNSSYRVPERLSENYTSSRKGTVSSSHRCEPRFLQTLTFPLDRRGVPEVSLSKCTVLEHLFVSVVGPETSFRRIASMLSSIASSRLRKVVLEAALREFPDIYCSVVRNVLMDGVSRLDQPLGELAKRIVLEDKEKLLFILLTHNALELAQQLTELSKEGDILIGEKVVGGDHSCMYIPATTCLRETMAGKAGSICDVRDFL